MKKDRNRQSKGPHKGGKDKSGGEFNWCDVDDIQRSAGGGLGMQRGACPRPHPIPHPRPGASPCPSPRDTHPQTQTGQCPRRLRGAWGGRQKEDEHRPEALPGLSVCVCARAVRMPSKVTSSQSGRREDADPRAGLSALQDALVIALTSAPTMPL